MRFWVRIQFRSYEVLGVTYVRFSLRSEDILGGIFQRHKNIYIHINICHIKYLDHQSLGTKTNIWIQLEFKFSL